MSHNNKIVDKDPCFEIDAITRQIRNVSSTKTTVMQYDHNSERFSFTLPRYIEGHDMMECTKAEVHYLNVDTPGIYTMTDLAVDETDENKVKCTWLLSQNATFKVGVLKFLLRFSCIAEDGTIEYAWSTGVYTQIMVSAGMYNSEEMFKPYSDVLEQLKTVFPGRKTGYGGVIFGDLINNMAAAPFTMATGSGCIAGMRGYFYSSIEFGEALGSGNYGPCRITLTKSQPIIFADAETPEAFAIGFKVGDVISMVNNIKFPDCATITAIEKNVITVDSLPFNAVVDMIDKTGNVASDDYSVFVATNPLAGDVPLGYGAFAGGEDAIALERAAFAFGRLVKALGQYGFAVNRETIAGYCAAAFGNKSKALGNNSFAINTKTEARETGTFAQGNGTIANTPEQAVFGRYNIIDLLNEFALIIGGGDNDSQKKNIFTFGWNGDLWSKGDLYFGGNDKSTAQKVIGQSEVYDIVTTAFATYTAKDLVAGITSEIKLKLLYEEDITDYAVMVDETEITERTPIAEKMRIASELLKAEKTRFVFYAGEEKVYTAAVKNTLPNRGMLFITE